MPKQHDMVPVERLVFVCKNLHELFHEDKWKNFLLSPLRQTRDFIQSRYLVFRNVMLEFLDVTDKDQGDKFVFFEEWNKCKRVSWVAAGIKVTCLDHLISYCKKYNKNVLEKFISASDKYEMGFKHQSALMDFKIQNRQVYTDRESKF